MSIKDLTIASEIEYVESQSTSRTSPDPRGCVYNINYQDVLHQTDYFKVTFHHCVMSS
uniref:Uncharacterized protein n=1 Tax=Anguilla anguilla TaxID=7936 RepID=A0A0E9QE02_ANGAN